MSKIKHKHTPGPWKRKHVFGGNNQIYGLAGEYITRDVDNGERYVCRMDGSTHAAIGQIANANLISAAPELLEVLVEILDDQGYLDDDAEDFEYEIKQGNLRAEMYYNAWKVIKKARGE